ncbi:MAG: LPS export ABC transporter permease LptG [Chakrabartia sp.]
MQTQFFPSRTMAIYMARTFLVRTLAVLAALVIVLQALDLLGESEKILAAAGNDNGDLWRYVSMRTPQIIQRFLPFSVLLGTLITMVTLNQNSEVISMKASGLSAHQVLAPLIIASLGVAVLAFTFNERIVTRATATLNRWQKVEYANIPVDSRTQSDIWVRSGSDLINAGSVEGRGRATRLSDIVIYRRAGGELQELIRAKTARPEADGWRMIEVSRFNVRRGVKETQATALVAQGVGPDRFTLADVDPDGLSFVQLWRAIDDLQAAGRPTQSLKSSLWHKISGPLSTLLMPLLAAVAAFGVARSGRLFVRTVAGMALGFAYFVADNFGLAMGGLGIYPPLLAAWGPFFLFLMIGEFVLIKTEE